MADKADIHIKLTGIDSRSLDIACKRILDTLKGSGARVLGPIPLPTRRKLYTLLTSPVIDKKSREQFSLTKHRRLIYIVSTASTSGKLASLEMPSDVSIEMAQLVNFKEAR